jgi:hypothetical protein
LCLVGFLQISPIESEKHAADDLGELTLRQAQAVMKESF